MCGGGSDNNVCRLQFSHVPTNLTSLPPLPLQLLRNRHGGIARYYLLRRGRFDHFCFDPSHRLLWPSGGKGAPGGPQGDVGDCGDAPEAWIVCEWDEELWLDLVALLYQLLGQAGGRPVSLSKLRTKMPQKTAEYISVGWVYLFAGGQTWCACPLMDLRVSNFPARMHVCFTLLS